MVQLSHCLLAAVNFSPLSLHLHSSSHVLSPNLFSPSVCKEDRRHSFHCSAVVCHDVIGCATRPIVSRHTQTHQAPDPNPDTRAHTHARMHTHTHTHTRALGLSSSFNHLRPLTLSETLMPGLRSLTYFYTHTKAASRVCCIISFMLSPSTAI